MMSESSPTDFPIPEVIPINPEEDGGSMVVEESNPKMIVVPQEEEEELPNHQEEKDVSAASASESITTATEETETEPMAKAEGKEAAVDGKQPDFEEGLCKLMPMVDDAMVVVSMPSADDESPEIKKPEQPNNAQVNRIHG